MNRKPFRIVLVDDEAIQRKNGSFDPLGPLRGSLTKLNNEFRTTGETVELLVSPSVDFEKVTTQLGDWCPAA